MIDINNIYIDIDVNYYIEEIKKDLANKQFISALAIKSERINKLLYISPHIKPIPNIIKTFLTLTQTLFIAFFLL